MHDTLTYFQSPPHQRPGKYHQLTFSMDYFYNERYLLPLSHDEGVHGKATIAQKMYGEYEGKFPQARALYLYMMAHPGKKLNFMGFELAQLREWDERRQQDWELLRYPVHDGFAHFIQTLNHLYLESPALWQQDYSREGFRWLACEPGPACLYAWERRGGGQRLVCLVCLGDAPAAGTLQIPGAKGLLPALHRGGALWWKRARSATGAAAPGRGTPSGLGAQLRPAVAGGGGVLFTMRKGAAAVVAAPFRFLWMQPAARAF